jgi:TPR repeat protein
MKLKNTLKLINSIFFCYLISGQISVVYAYDFSTGVFEFQKKLANKGDPQAQYKLGNMYENGQGVKVDLVQAENWYKKAAAQKHDAAKMRLTYIDIKKNGYQRQKHGAWLKKLQLDAENDDGEALFLLGTMYKKGIVVRKNLNKSAGYFKRATNKNIPGAEAELESVNSLLYNQRNKQSDIEKQKKTEAARKDKARKDKKLTKDKKKAAERRKKEQASQRAKQDRSKYEKERLAKEKQRQQKEKARKEKQHRALLAEQQAKEEAEKKALEEQKEKEEKKLNDKNMCKGKKARFLTTCR